MSGGRWPHIVVLDPFNSGLALARRMLGLGASVTVIVDPSEPFVARSRGVDGVIAPFEPAGEPWLEAIGKLAAASDTLAVLPATDRGSELLIRERGTLPSNILAFERTGSAHMALMDKARADSVARRAGVPVPWTACIEDGDAFGRLAAVAPWPCVVKPVLSHEWRRRYGEARTFLAESAEEAECLLARPLGVGMKMLLSQYIPGGDDDVEEAIVVRLSDGSYPVQFGCRKLRQYPPGFGVTALGESSRLPETTTLARRVLDEAGFVGVAGVETKRHSETGERWFLEVNVRMPAQWGLGDACGVQASPRLLDALCGRALPPAPLLRAGVRFAQPDVDWHVVLPMLRAAPIWQRPSLTWKLMRPYLGARELGLFDLRDPAPAIAFAEASLRRRVAHTTARLRLQHRCNHRNHRVSGR